ncbi:hypothetical protein EMIHUDRAFT_216910 [Emiliania huxleyi CCMP1516]|uniref:Uncharacterized protein n=2 Tax=Emiliania huxleyi TaxID=2903 RepID=A0A0D3ICT6_EMIH1|nr:hypothetical protein EMIHUDRAFT_216910 [Emiliania huxleyi CCMP1516]EOD09071.1 hypothetical protein EMIHUDRAFT_216910 [Emiliania huxleyi CCMP1516]|eukprot:XP_005761500.1 hypothetical protein EMIHUDRAFT_216910 [Emiliania huxleyi CCMP1516]
MRPNTTAESSEILCRWRDAVADWEWAGDSKRLHGGVEARIRFRLKGNKTERLLGSTLSSNTCAFTDDAGAGVPFGCIVTADNGISTGVLRVVIPEVCCRHRVGVSVAGYSHAFWHPFAVRILNLLQRGFAVA